jgi:hypothetical protein
MQQDRMPTWCPLNGGGLRAQADLSTQEATSSADAWLPSPYEYPRWSTCAQTAPEQGPSAIDSHRSPEVGRCGCADVRVSPIPRVFGRFASRDALGLIPCWCCACCPTSDPTVASGYPLADGWVRQWCATGASGDCGRPSEPYGRMFSLAGIWYLWSVRPSRNSSLTRSLRQSVRCSGERACCLK